MDVNAHITALMNDRGWSAYRLAQRSGLSSSALSNLFHRGTLPSIPTLEAICTGLGLTLAEFFATDEVPTGELRLLQLWRLLPPKERAIIIALLENMPLNGAFSSSWR